MLLLQLCALCFVSTTRLPVVKPLTLPPTLYSCANNFLGEGLPSPQGIVVLGLPSPQGIVVLGLSSPQGIVVLGLPSPQGIVVLGLSST